MIILSKEIRKFRTLIILLLFGLFSFISSGVALAFHHHHNDEQEQQSGHLETHHDCTFCTLQNLAYQPSQIPEFDFNYTEIEIPQEPISCIVSIFYSEFHYTTHQRGPPTSFLI